MSRAPHSAHTPAAPTAAQQPAMSPAAAVATFMRFARLDEATARAYLDLAGGDGQLANQLARRAVVWQQQLTGLDASSAHQLFLAARGDPARANDLYWEEMEARPEPPHAGHTTSPPPVLLSPASAVPRLMQATRLDEATARAYLDLAGGDSRQANALQREAVRWQQLTGLDASSAHQLFLAAGGDPGRANDLYWEEMEARPEPPAAMLVFPSSGHGSIGGVDAAAASAAPAPAVAAPLPTAPSMDVAPSTAAAPAVDSQETEPPVESEGEDEENEGHTAGGEAQPTLDETLPETEPDDDELMGEMQPQREIAVESQGSEGTKEGERMLDGHGEVAAPAVVVALDASAVAPAEVTPPAPVMPLRPGQCLLRRSPACGVPANSVPPYGAPSTSSGNDGADHGDAAGPSNVAPASDPWDENYRFAGFHDPTGFTKPPAWFLLRYPQGVVWFKKPQGRPKKDHRWNWRHGTWER